MFEGYFGRAWLFAGVASLAIVALPAVDDDGSFRLDPTSAFAGKGNGGGNGNGNGNGSGGNGSGNGNAGGASNGNGNAFGGDKDSLAQNDHGEEASSLGALNAANASTSALENASPNSRVGKIAEYKAAALEAQALQDTASDLEGQAAAAEAEVDQRENDLALAQDALDSALALNDDDDPENDVDAAELADLDQQVKNAEAALDQAESDAADADALAVAAQNAADAAQANADQQLVEAANKDITDEDGNVLSNVRDAVDDLLGID